MHGQNHIKFDFMLVLQETFNKWRSVERR